jgi:hypothetical protein
MGTFLTYIALAFVGFLIYEFMKDWNQKKDWENKREKWQGEEEDNYALAVCFIEKKSQLIRNCLNSIGFQESEIYNSYSIGGYKVADLIMLSPNGKISADDIERVKESKYNKNLEDLLYFTNSGIVYIKYPRFILDNKNIEAMDQLKIEPVKILFDEILDISYDEQTVGIGTGQSSSSGAISADITSSSAHMSDGDFGISLGKGKMRGTLMLSGQQSELSRDFTISASLKIFTTHKSQPFEISIEVIDSSSRYEEGSPNLHTLRTDPDWAFEHYESYHAPVYELRELYASISAHVKRKEALLAERLKLEFATSTLADDAYKIFLTEQFPIKRNDLLGKFVLHNKIFNSIDDALEFADVLFKNGISKEIEKPNN